MESVCSSDSSVWTLGWVQRGSFPCLHCSFGLPNVVVAHHCTTKTTNQQGAVRKPTLNTFSSERAVSFYSSTTCNKDIQIHTSLCIELAIVEDQCHNDLCIVQLSAMSRGITQSKTITYSASGSTRTQSTTAGKLRWCSMSCSSRDMNPTQKKAQLMTTKKRT